MKKIHPELSQLRFFYGIQSAIAIALPLLIGLLMGNLKLIILPALAAFFINLFLGSLSVSYRDKLLGMAIATLGCAGVMSLGTVSGQMPWLLVIFTFPLLLLFNFIGVLGSTATAIGQVVAVFWFISTHLPGNLDLALERFWLLLLAGIWVMVRPLVRWLNDPYRPVKQAIIASYQSLAHFLETVARVEMADKDELWDLETAQAQHQTGTILAQARSLWHEVYSSQPGTQIEGQRLIFLIEKLTDMYREVIALTEVVVGQNKRELAEMEPDLKQACQTLIEAMKTLDDIVKLRNTSDRQEIAQETLAMLTTLQQEVQDLKKKFRTWSNSQKTITPNLHKLIPILQNLAEQIDATITLLLDRQKQVKVALQSVPLTPVTSFWEILKNNWTFESINFTAAMRLATVTTFAMWVSILLHWHHGYWIALTVLFVLQPDYGGTIQKAIQRIGGTILGVILATPIVLQIQDLNLLIIILIILAALTVAFRFVNYAFFMLFLTMLIVVILDLDVAKDWQLAETRVFHTVLGGALVVISYYLWPIWQKRSLPRRIGILLEKSISYFQTVAAAYQGQAQSAKILDLSRRQAELASDNALATVQRMRQEPKRFQGNVVGTTELILNGVSFINGVTTLRQHLQQFQPSQTLPGLDEFIEQVTKTFENLQQIQQTGINSLSMPNFTQSLHRLTDYLETIPEAQTEEIISLTFILAELHQLTDKLKGMFAAIP